VEMLEDFGTDISPEDAMKEAVSAIHPDLYATYTSLFAERDSNDQTNKDLITCIVAQRHDERLQTRGDDGSTRKRCTGTDLTGDVLNKEFEPAQPIATRRQIMAEEAIEDHKKKRSNERR
jgi:hypothetical protein